VNIEFFSSSELAMRAGYRPCKRCRPLHTDGRHPQWVSKLLAATEEGEPRRLRDYDIRQMGIDPARARRYFQKEFGMTFQAYQRSARIGSAFQRLRNGDGELSVGMDVGFESSSGFRDAFARVFGATPGRHDDVQCAVMAMLRSPVGSLVTAATDEGVCLLEFADRPALARQADTLRKRLGVSVVPGMNRHLEQLEVELREYFAGERRTFNVALVTPGTDFQRQVWNRLRQIPYGETMSYEGMAEAIGRPGAQRAVGKANGDNRIAIVIPCHRVVQKNGALRGYGGGLWRKRFLLDLEAVAISDKGTARPEAATKQTSIEISFR